MMDFHCLGDDSSHDDPYYLFKHKVRYNLFGREPLSFCRVLPFCVQGPLTICNQLWYDHGANIPAAIWLVWEELRTKKQGDGPENMETALDTPLVIIFLPHVSSWSPSPLYLFYTRCLCTPENANKCALSRSILIHQHHENASWTYTLYFKLAAWKEDEG